MKLIDRARIRTKLTLLALVPSLAGMRQLEAAGHQSTQLADALKDQASRFSGHHPVAVPVERPLQQPVNSNWWAT